MPSKDKEANRERHRLWAEKNREHVQAYKKRYYEEHREYLRQQRVEHKTENNAYSIAWYYSHKEQQSARAKKYNMAIKQEVLTHYGEGRCACVRCGESRLACLSIDHINGNGAKHRREAKLQGIAIYLWLRRESYPDGYQTLCMNDQFIKRVENQEYAPNGVVSG